VVAALLHRDLLEDATFGFSRRAALRCLGDRDPAMSALLGKVFFMLYTTVFLVGLFLGVPRQFVGSFGRFLVVAGLDLVTSVRLMFSRGLWWLSISPCQYEHRSNNVSNPVLALSRRSL
jgi:hypothetical protein